LHQSGRFRVFSASRTSNPELQKLSTYIETDVTKDDSVQFMIRWVQKECQQIDVLVHAAGYALAGSIEDTTVEEAQQQFDTNFWGVVRVNKAVLPKMRESRRGTIINIGSVAGLIPMPFQAYYSASKFALEAFCDVLHYEVQPFGVRVHLIQPGDLKTPLTQNRRYASGALNGTVYKNRLNRCMENISSMESRGQSADKVARAVVRLAGCNSSTLRYRIAKPLEECGLLLRRLGFYKTYNRLARTVFGDFEIE
jgi:short-subunit dehydrogenase